MRTSMRRKLAIGAGAALAVAGGGGAIGATQLSPRAESKAVVEDAAKQLGVDPAKLSDALKQALENRVDEAVRSGRLTEEQGERLKERIQADDHPLFGGPGVRGHGFGGPGPRGHGRALRRGASLDAAAGYLGISEEALRQNLRGGKTLAAIAKEKGKSVDGLVDALVAEHVKRLDAAVEAGRLTKARRDELVAQLKERTTALVNGERPALGKREWRGEGNRFRRGQGFGFGRPGLAPPPRENASYRGGDDLPPAA